MLPRHIAFDSVLFPSFNSWWFRRMLDASWRVERDATQQEYVRGRKEGWLQNDGNSVKYIAQHGPLSKAIL